MQNASFVGYFEETKGFWFYNPASCMITVSIDAKFAEH
jgi:hypothetical protein